VVFSIRLPLAPSTNHYWRSWVRPGSTRVMTHVSSEGQAYKAAVAAAWLRHFNGWPPERLTGRLRLLVSVSYFNSTKIDLDNRIKPLQDALTDCEVWADDSQIDDLRAIRGPAADKPGYMDVMIESIP
jgi:Holliday junction resolvase RusA-like endonuclease